MTEQDEINALGELLADQIERAEMIALLALKYLTDEIAMNFQAQSVLCTTLLKELSNDQSHNGANTGNHNWHTY